MFTRQFYPQARADLGLVPVDETVSAESLISIGAIRPISLSVEHNNIRTADTFEVEIAENRFPIDPRLVRSAVVDLHLADVGGIDAVLDTDSSDSRIILGNADQVSKSFSNSGDVAKFKGRDYKGLLLDEEWADRAPALGRPLDEIVADVLEGSPATASLVVETRLEGSAPIVPAGIGKKRSAYRTDADTPVLEALTTLALSVGVIVTVEHDRVIIQPPRSYNATTDTLAFFTLSKNLTKLDIERSFGKRDLPNIRIKAYDPRTGELVSGQYPATFEKKPRAIKTRASKKRTTTDNIREYSIRHAAPTPKALGDIARQVFNRFAQQQISVSIETKDLVVETNRSEPDFPDLISVSRLRNGGAIRVRVEPGTRDFLEKALTPDQKERELRAQGYSAQLARTLSRNWRILDTPLFIDSASHSFSGDSGYSFSAKASPFVTVDL